MTNYSVEQDVETPVSSVEPEADNNTLKHCVTEVMENYLRDMDGHQTHDLYKMVLAEVEQPLLETILKHTRGNQSQAAEILGINRGTLSKKLKEYDLL